MASALHTKINSYMLNRGIEFNESVSNTPTRTGTNGNGVFAQNTALNTVYESTVGPAGGSGSWKFTYATGTGIAGMLRNATNSNTTEGAGISDSDWSVGFWFKLSALPNGTNSGVALLSQAASQTTSGYGVGISASGATGGFAGKIWYQASSTTGTFWGPVITVGVWHYVAIVKAGANISYFYDGQLLGSRTDGVTSSTSITSVVHGTSSYSGATNTVYVNYSNYYLTSSAQIGATQVAEIWVVGSTASSYPLKYWNGSAWTTPVAMKQWNGSSWITMNGKVWNGTAWITIT